MLKLPQPTPTLTRDEEHLQDLQGIFEVARANNLRLGQVDHQWAPDPKPGIRLHTMTVQMSDSYPRIRSFLHSMAETFPHLGIHSLTVERPDLQATEVDTTFQFLMLYRASAGSTNVD
ncbi:hypothetical protein [Hydrogenophaga sp. T2]|uniref:hypothetical protein n=1 Tax=Hydrogenophaga sp. T2 TaxID=3132823 RepID=UPI003CF6BFB8